jgi:hypothetical protein
LLRRIEELAQLGRERDRTNAVSRLFVRQIEAFLLVPIEHDEVDTTELVEVLCCKLCEPGRLRRSIGVGDAAAKQIRVSVPNW